MDESGIYAQVVYPNGVGFASNHIFAIDDPNQRDVVLQAFNDFFCEVQEESRGRLLPQAILPIWDMDLTIKQMTKLLDRGITGFTLSDKPELLGLPELPEPYFEPMWDLLNQSGAVANFHINSGATRIQVEEARKQIYHGQKSADGFADRGPLTVAAPAWKSLPREMNMGVQATLSFMSNVRIITNLCMSTMFDRYPNLKIVSAESGIGWVPFVLESLEYQFDEMGGDRLGRAGPARRPSEYFHDHIFVMFWFEQAGPATQLEAIGVNNVLVETDFPHPVCLYPNPLEHFAKVLSGLDPHIVRRVLQDNAAELYKVKLPNDRVT